MKSKVELLKALSKNYNQNKDKIFEIMTELDSYFLENYKNVDFTGVPLFKESPEEIYEKVLHKLELYDKAPCVALPDGIRKIFDILHDYVKENSLGFVSEFKISNTGIMQIKINCMIMTSTFVPKETPERQKERQLNTLEKLGLETVTRKDMGGLFLVASDKNIFILKDLFEQKKAKHVEIIIAENQIQEINFFLDPADILLFVSEKSEPVNREINGLTEVELYNIKKHISDMLDAYSCYDSLRIQGTCGYVLYASFAELSKIFKIETKIRKKIEDYHSKERSLNMQIEEKSELLGDKVNIKHFKKIISEISLELEKTFAEKLGLNISNFSIDRNGFIHFELKRNEEFCIKTLECMGIKTMPIQMFRKIFITSDRISSYHSENEKSYILDMSENKVKLEKMIKEMYPSAYIDKLELSKINGKFVIERIYVSLTDITDFVKE